MPFIVYKKNAPKQPLTRPLEVASADQAVGFYVRCVLKRGYDKNLYYAEDPKAEAAKRHQRDQEQTARRNMLWEQFVETLFESHECVCGQFVEIEPGVPEPTCSVCGGHVALPIAV